LVILTTPVLGNLVKNFLEAGSSAFGSMQFPQFRLMFLAATVLIALMNFYYLVIRKDKSFRV
jgi:hypothetical protein